MPVVTNPMVGVLYINGGTKGWGEKYFLNESSYLSALTTFGKLVMWRAATMARDFELAWARVSFADVKHDSKAAISAPLAPLDDGTPAADTAGFGLVNKTEDGFLVRFETATGRWTNRCWRGVPDIRMSDDELVGALVIPPTPLVAVPALAATTWLECFGNLISFVRNFTMHTRISTVAGVKQYDMEPYDRALFRRPAIRRTGRPFDTSRGRAA